MIEDEIYIKEINKMIDVHEHYENKGERIDVFYGSKRVYVTLRKSNEIRKTYHALIKEALKLQTLNKVNAVCFSK